MSATELPTREVSVVCPTYMEGPSIATFLARVQAAATGFRRARLAELIFVDDGSTDGTRETIQAAARSWAAPTVVLVERDRKDGTVSAQIEGFRRATHDLVVTMDADGQHPSETIDRLVAGWSPGIDLVVASRHVPGGQVEWEEARRGVISGGARALARLTLPGARRLRDPLSGFFLVRRDWVAGLPRVSGRFKLLLYVLAMHPQASLRELPYPMGVRIAGESKLIRGLGFIPRYLGELRQYRRAAAAARRAPVGE